MVDVLDLLHLILEELRAGRGHAGKRPPSRTLCRNGASCPYEKEGRCWFRHDAHNSAAWEPLPPVACHASAGKPARNEPSKKLCTAHFRWNGSDSSCGCHGTCPQSGQAAKFVVTDTLKQEIEKKEFKEELMHNKEEFKKMDFKEEFMDNDYGSVRNSQSEGKPCDPAPDTVVDQWEFLLDIHGNSGSPVMALIKELQAKGFSKDELLGICYREGVLLKHDVLHSQLSALRDGWNHQCTKR